MTTPKLSVCLDNFNYGRFLPEAIESILRQDFRDFEIVISDDCSTDDSFAIAQRFTEKDPRIRLARNPQNLGMVKNRNVCLRLARGEYVKWLHADDFLTSPTALSQMVAALDANHAISLVAAARRIVSEKGEPLETWSCFEETRPLAGTTVIQRCLFEQRNLIGGPSAVMFRRTLAARGFDEDFFVMADMEMWFHLLEQGCFAYIAEPLCAFRTHGVQQTEKDRTSLAPALENHALLRRYLDRPYVRFRRWIRRYLEYDAVYRIDRRSRKLGFGREHLETAVREYGGWERYRSKALKRPLRETQVKVRRLYERHLRRLSKTTPLPRPPGINMAGFAQSVYGIGESSRALWRAVQATGLPCVLINVRSNVHSNADASVVHHFTSENPYRLNLMTFSFDYSRRFYRDMGPKFFAGRHNVGLWYWEQERFPVRWHSSFDYYDEIWVPSEFTRAAIGAVSPVPVRKITYPFQMNEAEAVRDRARFGLREDACVFLFNFDFHSTTHRKNPGAVIEAFRRAFGSDERVVLVMKSINANVNPEGREELGRQAAGANVLFLDEHISSAEVNSLFASADCYVSLHRSEGLGLGMAQAMYLGKPVIATGYSGNLDFMDAESALLVDYEMTELHEDSGAYERGSHWADPNIDQAAGFMREVFENPGESRAMGARAAAKVREALNPERTVSELRRRVGEL